MSMNCMFCKKPVVGQSPVTVPGIGLAHSHCYQADQALRRTFQSLDIAALSDGELTELKDLVLAEENARRPEHDDDDDIELF